MVSEQARRQVRGQSDHRAHRQVHVPADHHHRLTQREQRERGRIDQYELDVQGIKETGPHERGDPHEDDEDGDDAGLAESGRRARRGRRPGPGLPVACCRAGSRRSPDPLRLAHGG